MDNKRQLSKRQVAVIDDLFAGEVDEQAVLARHKVSRRLYDRWQSEQGFADEFGRRIAALNRRGECIIAGYVPLAASKLIQLTESENQETARKACLDIISLAEKPLNGKPDSRQISETANSAEQISPETAAKLLAALAEE